MNSDYFKSFYIKYYKIFLFVLVLLGLIFALRFEKIYLYNNSQVDFKLPLNKQFIGNKTKYSKTNGEDFWTSDSVQQITGELLISPKKSWEPRKRKISTAKDFLYIWIYNITNKDSKALIKSLARDEVSIKMIMEDDKYGVDDQQTPRGRGIQIRNDAKLHTNFVHAKTFVSDDFYIIQTANLTNGGFGSQREYYIIGEDKGIIDNLKGLFEKDRDGDKITATDIHPNILFCPIDCRFKIEGLLKNAKKSIYIQNQYLDDQSITRILQSKTDLDLRLILPKNEKNIKKPDGLIEHIKLLKSPYVHAKAILIDNEFLIISSINFSSNSLDNNREIGIIVTNQNAIRNYQEQFETDWGNSE